MDRPDVKPADDATTAARYALVLVALVVIIYWVGASMTVRPAATSTTERFLLPHKIQVVTTSEGAVAGRDDVVRYAVMRP